MSFFAVKMLVRWLYTFAAEPSFTVPSEPEALTPAEALASTLLLAEAHRSGLWPESLADGH
jgi:hypothetical protein